MPWLGKSGMPRPISWKSNLAAIWVSQFISLSAFSFSIPFLPIYLKEKNIVPAEEAPFWSGIFIAAAPVSMMIMAPIWGMLGDRYGRKMMLVRANLAGAFVLYLMSVIDNMEGLIVLRLLQGAFTGTVPSAQSLVSAATPDKHQGFALGLMMAALNAANTAGAFFGGFYAQRFGAEATFRMSGYMLVAATIMVVTMVRENFTPPVLGKNTRSARIRRRKEGVNQLKSSVPALLVIGFVALIMTFDGPFMALYVETLRVAAGNVDPSQLHGEVYRLTGDINALASIIAVGGSISISYIMDKKTPRFVWGLLALMGASGPLIIYHIDTVWGLTLGRTVFLFFMSGLSSVLIVLLSRNTPTEKRGSSMGWAVTFRSFGWVSAPLMGGWIAQNHGYGEAYYWLGILTLALVVIFPALATRYPDAFGRKFDKSDLDGDFDEVAMPPQSMQVSTKASVRLLIKEDKEEGKGTDN